MHLLDLLRLHNRELFQAFDSMDVVVSLSEDERTLAISRNGRRARYDVLPGFRLAYRFPKG